MLAPVAAVLGGCSALFLPASMSLMPTLLDAGRLPAANAVYTGALQIGSLMGPVIGGVVVATAGPAAAFSVDAATYAVSAASLALMASGAARRTAANQAAALLGKPAAEPGSVWALLRSARVLQIILMVSVTANFALTGTTEVALPSLAHARFGAVLTCVAAGSLAGTLIVVRAGRRARPTMLLCGAFGVAAVSIALRCCSSGHRRRCSPG